ncbi:MAG: EF-P lysine aminoacylase EpmA [Pseudomonadota bacterium]
MSGDDWRPTASIEALRLRAALYRRIRGFFDARGVLDVETPILSEAGNTDPNIESLRARFDGPTSAGARERWLRTSPEYPLKRLLAAGIGDCYELGRVFRNGESGARHNPEFTMLEWYRVGWDHHRLMDEVAELVGEALALVGRAMPVRKRSYAEVFIDHAGVDPHHAPPEALRAALGHMRIDGEGLSRDDWLDLVLTHRVEPAMATSGHIEFIHDFPASQAALSRIRPGDPPLAERFECYVDGIELANGYHELTDPHEQRARFEADLAKRRARGAVEPPIDARLLAALTNGLPHCAGVAMGIERLLVVLLMQTDIACSMAFAVTRA